MRILFLTPVHSSWTRQEISILNELEHDVRFLFTTEHGVKIKRFPSILTISGLYDNLKIFLSSIPFCSQCELIYCWFVFPTGLVAAVLGKLFRKPVVLNAVGHDVADVPEIEYGASRVRYYRPLIKWALINATKVLAISKESAKRAEILGARRVDVIYEAIDTVKFKPSSNLQERKNKSFLLLTVSPLVNPELIRKDFDTLLKAFSKVVADFPSAKLVIVGEKGNAYPDLKRVVEELRIQGNVVFEGYVAFPRLLSLYGACDVFVLPSIHEGFPTVCAEAQACGKPVISTHTSSMPEVIENNETGILVKPRDPEVLSNAIQKLLSDAKLREQLGKSGRKRVTRFFSKEIRKKKLKKVLLDLQFQMSNVDCKQHEEPSEKLQGEKVLINASTLNSPIEYNGKKLKMEKLDVGWGLRILCCLPTNFLKKK